MAPALKEVSRSRIHPGGGYPGLSGCARRKWIEAVRCFGPLADASDIPAGMALVCP